MTAIEASATRTNAGHDRPREYANALALMRRFIGSRRTLVAAVILLIVEALAATIEPFPIAYLVDYLNHSKKALNGLWLPVIHLDRIHVILLLTAAIVLIAAVNSASDSGAEVCLARAGRLLGYNLRVA